MFKHNSLILKLYSLLVLLTAIGCFSNNSYQTPETTSTFNKNGRRGALPPNAQPGKCYAQHFERQFEIDSLQFFEYAGDNFEQEGVEKKEIEIANGSVKWETKIDPNCKAQNTNDCKVKCLIEIPPKFATFYIVTDTNIVKNYNNKVIEKKRFGKTKPQWLEVICESQLTQNFYKKLKDKLLEINYLDASISTVSRNNIKEAFVQYQTDNNLPSGHFFVATLMHIGF